MFTVTQKLGLVVATFIQVYRLPHPLLSGAPGSLKALIYMSLFNVFFLAWLLC